MPQRLTAGRFDVVSRHPPFGGRHPPRRAAPSGRGVGYGIMSPPTTPEGPHFLTIRRVTHAFLVFPHGRTKAVQIGALARLLRAFNAFFGAKTCHVLDLGGEKESVRPSSGPGKWPAHSSRGREIASEKNADSPPLNRCRLAPRKRKPRGPPLAVPIVPHGESVRAPSYRFW